MKYFIQFFINPKQYFRNLNDRKTKRYLLNLLVVYVIIYVIYSIQIDAGKNANQYFFSNALVNFSFNFLLDMAVSILIISTTLHVIAKFLKIQSIWIEVVFNIFSLKAIEILVMLVQISIFNVLGDIAFIKTLDTISWFCFLSYLYFPIRNIFKINFFKTIALQIIVVFVVFSLYSIIVAINPQPKVSPDISKVVEYLKNDEIDESINESVDIINMDPVNANLRFAIGEAYSMYLLMHPDVFLKNNIQNSVYQKVFHQAEESYSSALNLNPSNNKARKALGDLYRLNGDYGKALEQYSIAVEKGYSDPDIYRKMAIAYFRLGNQESAERYYKLDPGKEVYNSKTKIMRIATQEIPTLSQNLGINAELNLKWHISNEMLYDLSSGDNDLSELWVKTALSLSFNELSLADQKVEDSFIDLVDSSADSIIAESNNFLEENRYGIKITSLELKKP